MGHPSPVCIPKKLVSHEPGALQCSDPQVLISYAFECGSKPRKHIKLLPAITSHFGPDHLRDFPRHENGLSEHVGAFQSATELEQTRVFRRDSSVNHRTHDLAQTHS